MLALLLAAVAAGEIVLDNDYVRVTRDAAPCAEAVASDCGDRVIVALSDLELKARDETRKLTRGDIAVFAAGEAHEPPAGGAFFEVAIKPSHPPVLGPPETIAPEKNAMRFEGKTFFVFEEKLEPGATRARHSHAQRVVLQLNRAKLQQWPDGKEPIFVETVPEKPTFSPPVIHVVKNVGEVPLRGVIVELRP